MQSAEHSPPPDRKKPLAASEMAKLLVALIALAIAGVYIYRQMNPPRESYTFDPSKPIAFKDNAQSNAPLVADVESLQFVDSQGQPFDLAQYRGKSNVVLVVTRGNTTRTEKGPYVGNICLYCATQASRLVANYSAFRDRDAEPVVVFPIRRADDKESLGEFTAAIKRDGSAAKRDGSADPPFPLVIDVELAAVDRLGIRADLARPATYILDKEGQLRFAYVGATIADRPSVQSMLDQLDAIDRDAK